MSILQKRTLRTMQTANDLFIDTSGWAYYLDRQDQLHPTMVALVKQAIIERRRLVTTNYIITELLALLSSRYHLPRPQGITAINPTKQYPSLAQLYIDPS